MKIQFCYGQKIITLLPSLILNIIISSTDEDINDLYKLGNSETIEITHFLRHTIWPNGTLFEDEPQLSANNAMTQTDQQDVYGDNLN